MSGLAGLVARKIRKTPLNRAESEALSSGYQTHFFAT